MTCQRYQTPRASSEAFDRLGRRCPLKRTDILEEDPKRRRSILEAEYRERNPWIRHLKTARQRCNNPNNVAYKFYGGKGVKCLLTLKDVEFLWHRDKAAKMHVPSIDRKNNNAGYIFANCCFMERADNCWKASALRQRIVRSVSSDGTVRLYVSIHAAARALKVNDTRNIRSCLTRRSRTAYGLQWEFVT